MTRTEQTGIRNLDFSGWIRRTLTSAKGFTVFDVDFIFRDYERKLLQMVEVKTHGADLSTMQRIALGELALILQNGIQHSSAQNGWRWCGFHVLRFEGTSPANGKIMWDGQLVSEKQLVELLEMRQV
jgi:hypothetical protein